jgi:hypothetical protein
MRKETIAALAARKPAPGTPPRSDKLATTCEAYDMAHAEYLESAGSVTAARGDRNAAGAASLVGLVVLALSSSSTVWGLGLLVALGAGALAVRQQLSLQEARDRCQTAIQKMYMEYRVAKKESGKSDLLPDRPAQACT